MREPENDYDVALEGSLYDILRVTMPADVIPSHLGGFTDAVRGAYSEPIFWAAIGRHAGFMGLRVFSGDTTNEGVAHVTLRR